MGAYIATSLGRKLKKLWSQPSKSPKVSWGLCKALPEEMLVVCSISIDAVGTERGSSYDTQGTCWHKEFSYSKSSRKDMHLTESLQVGREKRRTGVILTRKIGEWVSKRKPQTASAWCQPRRSMEC